MRAKFGPLRALFLPLPRPQASAPPRLSGLRHLSRSALQEILWGNIGARISPANYDEKSLLGKLESAVGAQRVDEAWETFDRLRLSGSSLLPPRSLICGLIAATCYSPDPRRLRRAYQLASALSHRRSDLLHYDSLSRLALALARAQMPEPSGEILRLMLETNKLPNTPLWSAAFSHMVRSAVGSYVAAGVLIDLCDFFLRCPTNSKRWNMIKPNVILFNLVLHSSVRFRSPLKAHQMFDIMPKTGVVADVSSIVALSKICGMNGLREDLKKLKPYIDVVSSPLLNLYYQHFYDSLLSLHFKFNDLDAVAELILGLYQRFGSPPQQNLLPETFILQIGSGNLKTGSRLIVKPTSLAQNLSFEVDDRPVYIVLKDGKLFPSYYAITKLILGCVSQKKLEELSKMLVGIYKAAGCSANFNLGSEVVVSCVELGWLNIAHDLLDDMESAGVSFPEATYSSLLKAYCKRNNMGEARVLIKQMKERCLMNLADEEEAMIFYLSLNEKDASPGGISALGKLLEKQSKEEDRDPVNFLTHEFNFSIFFFCKAGMMDDAIKTFRKMQERKVQPNIQTFSHLVNGYSSLEMYREITIIWGEIKKRLGDGILSPDRDLYECLLWNFIRGGYFERTMEIASYMEESRMYVDKGRFRREFLKLHRNLYRNLNMSDVKTDAQRKRLEHVRAFRKWIGIARTKRIRSRG